MELSEDADSVGINQVDGLKTKDTRLLSGAAENRKKAKIPSRRRTRTGSGSKASYSRGKQSPSPSSSRRNSGNVDIETYRKAEALAGSFIRRGGREGILGTPPRKRSSRSSSSSGTSSPGSQPARESSDAFLLHGGGGGGYGTFGMGTTSMPGFHEPNRAHDAAVADQITPGPFHGVNGRGYSDDTSFKPTSTASATSSYASRRRAVSTPIDLDHASGHNEHSAILEQDEDGVVSDTSTADSLFDSGVLTSRLLPHMASDPTLTGSVHELHKRNISHSAPDLRQKPGKDNEWTPGHRRTKIHTTTSACHSRINRFQRRHGLPISPEHATPDPENFDLELTPRALVIGSFFAIINAAVNMFFQFRYAGGLYQYWVILLSYPLGKLTEKFPRGRLLNPGPFLAKEHFIMMTIGIAGSVAGNLGLAGGMLALELDFDVKFEAWQIFIWTFVAGFFGLFFGNFFFKSLVLSNKYDWPFSKVNAAYIAAFHYYGPPPDNAGRSSSINGTDQHIPGQRGMQKHYAALKVFGIFFVVSFVWFIIPNYFLPVLFSMSMLCWGSAVMRGGSYGTAQPFGQGDISQHIFDVLGSGEAGAGIPGMGGWSTVWSFGPSIIPLASSVWIVAGVVLMNWILIPASFYMHVTAWPSSFNLFNGDGGFYNNTEGHYARTKEPVYLSGYGLAMYAGVCLSVVATLFNTLIDCFLRLRTWTHRAIYQCEVRSRRLQAAEKAIRTPSKIEERFQDYALDDDDQSDDTETPSCIRSESSASASPRRELRFSTRSNMSETSATLPAVVRANQNIDPMTSTIENLMTTETGTERLKHNFQQLFPKRQFQPPKKRSQHVRAPMNMRLSCIVVSLLTLMAVLVVRFGLPALEEDGTPGLGMPILGTVLCIVYSCMASYGVGVVYASSGQNLKGPMCILLQMLMGLFVPHNPRANVVSTMICLTVVSQSLAFLSDLKTALYIGAQPRLVFYAQIIGAFIGVLVSAAVFILVLHLNDEGLFKIGTAEWPAVQANSVALNAKIFGDIGIEAIFQGAVLYILIPCFAFGIIGPILLRLVPTDVTWRKWMPDPVLLGIGGLCPGLNYCCVWLLLLAVVYQLFLKYKRPQWYRKYQYVSTSGVNAGVGLSSFLVLLAYLLHLPFARVGPEAAAGSCNNVSLPAKTLADVACFNNNEGCNTPWPSN